MMNQMTAFSTPAIDRDDHTRTDPVKLAELRASSDARLLVLDGLAPEMDADHRLVWSDLSATPPDAELVFLGLLAGAAAFAAVPATGDNQPAYAIKKGWEALMQLSLPELALYGGARSLVDWHARHRFCAKCGHGTLIAKGGWQRNCTGDACTAEHFPRVDPVSIMLVEHDGDLLLGRQGGFPKRSYSALAGFIEPGENIEQAVRREVLEEAGVVVGEVRYLASQPWPFPSQLMIGCHAAALTRELTVDYTELEDARWFTRAEVAEAIEKGEASTSFLSPPSRAIAHHMLKWWLERGE